MTEEDETYNGYKNKPTWLVYTWLSGYKNAEEMARAVAYLNSPETFRSFVEGYLRMDERTAGLDVDLLQWVLGDVDWDRLVEAFRKG